MSSPSRITRSGTDSPRGPHRVGSLSPSPSAAVLNQHFIRVHANVGVDVVPLRFADQRIQTRPRIVACPKQRFQAVDQGILVGAVQRVAGLEGDHSLPALLGQQTADVARRQNVLAESRVPRLRQHLDRAAQQMRLVGVGRKNHVAAGMIGSVGQIDAAEILLLVPTINIGDVQHGDDLAGRIDQRHLLAGSKLLGQRFGNGQGQRDRPGVELAVVFDHRLVEHAVVGGRIHWPHQRAQAAVAQAIDRRQIGVGNGHLGERLGMGEKIVNRVGRHGAADRLGQTAVGGY